MTDRELLELAAKAAGLAIDKSYGDKTGFDVCGNLVLDWNNGVTWNPLDDDGDAFRLAVGLGLHISQQLSYVAVIRPHGGPGSHLMQWSEQYGTDPLAATRRAIVRAAAQIGKEMK